MYKSQPFGRKSFLISLIPAFIAISLFVDLNAKGNVVW